MYTPMLPGSSLTSWLYLKENQDAQVEAFSRDGILTRERENFVTKIAQMGSVDDLMKDYQALKVALGAHGLQEDLPNRYFVQQVIEQGTTDDDAFANRLSDGRYTALAKTFEDLGLTGSGDLRDSLPTLSDDLAAAIERSYGESPIYLNAAAKLSSNLTLGMLGADTAENIWERALATPSLNQSLTKILGTSGNLSGLNTDQQIAVLQESTEFLYGSSRLSALVDPDIAFEVADKYLGTTGSALEDAFSYGELSARLATATASSTDSDVQWAALQADTALRDIIASVVGVSAGFSGLSAADQIAELKAGTEDFFGRSDFSVFSSQANQTELGDRYLDPDGLGLDSVFSLGAFTTAIEDVRAEGASVDETWESVLAVDEMREALKEAFDLSADFDDLDTEEQISLIKAATEARFGTSDASLLQDPEIMAELTGLYIGAQLSEITENYVEQEYRVAVGELRPELRVALSVAEELKTAVESGGTDNGQWYRVLGNSVLRTAFEGAYGLSSDFAQVDLDAQVSAMKEMTFSLIGSESVADFLDEENQEKLINRYLARAGTTTSSTDGTVAALFTEASASSILATIYNS